VVLKALAIDNGSLVIGCAAAEAGRSYRLESADRVLGPWLSVVGRSSQSLLIWSDLNGIGRRRIPTPIPECVFASETGK
jgi:hypothetical protein